ncbi:MAG: hypothetical protein KF778_21430 [Rhodocyclaceae bacterium]|nr:hypothetical protein [Rhodocyclaceae bacterium]
MFKKWPVTEIVDHPTDPLFNPVESGCHRRAGTRGATTGSPDVLIVSLTTAW